MSAAPAPRLVVHDALGRRTVAIDKPRFTIGRRDGHDLQPGGAGVSRDHAEIAETPAGYVLRDVGSHFGTFVNGARISERLLAYGDRIELGGEGAALIFLAPDVNAASQTRPVPGVGDLRQVTVLLDALQQMGSHRVLDEVLAMVLDAAIAATGAERGVILLAGEGAVLEARVARAAGRVPLPTAGFGVSRKIPDEVFTTGRFKAVADLLEGDMAAVHTGTVALGIRHVLCAPLRIVRYVDRGTAPSEPANLGVLYLDSREKGRLLAPAAHAALEALAAEAALAIESARLYQRALENARLADDIRVASRIQQALLPEPGRSGSFFEAVGASVPSRAIGGDFFDYQDLSAGRFGFALGDVTGKGPPAALLTALVQGILASMAPAVSEPDEVVRIINRILLARRIESRYLTLFLGFLSADGTLTYCNAAQNPPLLVSGGRVRRLETGGTVIGAFPDAVYARETVQLVDGDTVVLFSDGITEALDAAGEEFGEDRVRDAVEPAIGAPAETVLRTLLDAVREFARGEEQHDDLTAVVLRYRRSRA